MVFLQALQMVLFTIDIVLKICELRNCKRAIQHESQATTTFERPMPPTTIPQVPTISQPQPQAPPTTLPYFDDAATSTDHIMPSDVDETTSS